MILPLLMQLSVGFTKRPVLTCQWVGCCLVSQMLKSVICH